MRHSITPLASVVASVLALAACSSSSSVGTTPDAGLPRIDAPLVTVDSTIPVQDSTLPTFDSTLSVPDVVVTVPDTGIDTGKPAGDGGAPTDGGPANDGTTPTVDAAPVETGSPDDGGSPGEATTTDAPASSDGGAPTDAASDCRHAPYKPYAESDAGGVYCPFSKTGDAGKNKTCTGGTQECCVTPESANTPSTCETVGTACPVAKSVRVECEGTPDCVNAQTGTICCGYGTIETQAACGSVPAYPYVSGFNYGPSGVLGTGGTFCATTCSVTGTDGGAVPTYQVCSQTSECHSGSTCVGIDPSGVGIGYCQAGI